MINEKTILAIIPARGGSKGVLRKNIRGLGGKPLIAWTIAAAKKSKYIDRLILSSDDDEIIKVAEEWGCEVPFVRPAPLAQDDTPGIDVVIHAIEFLPKLYDYIVLLQPTSPFRNVQDIDKCIELCVEKGANACVSVTEPEKSPYWMYELNEQGQMIPLIEMKETITRRQDLPQVYALNGAVYVAKRNWLLQSRSFIKPETIAYIMPRERSFDIDTEVDLAMCNFMLKNK